MNSMTDHSVHTNHGLWLEGPLHPNEQVELRWVGFSLLINTIYRQVILEMIFAANLLTGTKHPAFATNDRDNTNKTKHSYNQDQHKNIYTLTRKHICANRKMKVKSSFQGLLCHQARKQNAKISQHHMGYLNESCSSLRMLQKVFSYDAILQCKFISCQRS